MMQFTFAKLRSCARLLVVLLLMMHGSSAVRADSYCFFAAAIPDNSEVLRTVIVPPTSNAMMIQSIRVHAVITHPWVGDLVLRLRNPEGFEVSLLNRAGMPSVGYPGAWGCGGDNIDVWFDDAASAAAELISSGFVAATERTARLREDLKRRVKEAVEVAGERLDHARSRLRLLAPSAQVERGFLRLDDLSNRLGAALGATVQARRQRLSEVRSLLRERSPQRRVESESQRLLALWKRLQAASPASVLNRGFVIMRDEDGKPVQKKAAVRKGQRLAAEFADGTVAVAAEGGDGMTNDQ